ncbi:hypothetical protein [Nocardia sp. NPDC004860]|uniref:hypothetical protein n=1 Tax=Nocardia sp. NPDC004860 TaxID=3154557 RepID=UPI0033B2FCA1
MSTSGMLRRRIGWGATSLMAGAAVVGMTAATASADGLLQMKIIPPSGGFVVGATAGIQAMAGGSLFPTASSRVIFRDNGVCFYAFYPGMDEAGFGAEWTPTTAGTHTVTLSQGSDSVTQTVVVAPAPAGTPVPSPSTTGCGGGGGSIGTGSLGF